MSHILPEDPVPSTARRALDTGDSVAWFIYWTGYKTGEAAEIARQAMIVQQLDGYLGTVPDVGADDYTKSSAYTRPNMVTASDAGSSAAGALIRRTALQAWRDLWAAAEVVAA